MSKPLHPQNKELSRLYLLAARCLLLLTGILLLAMPLTEHFWNFDRFLQSGTNVGASSGQDFELTLLATLAVLCLVLLLAHSLRALVQTLLARCRSRLCLEVPSPHPPPPASQPRRSDCFRSLPGEPPSGFALPLQI